MKFTAQTPPYWPTEKGRIINRWNRKQKEKKSDFLLLIGLASLDLTELGFTPSARVISIDFQTHQRKSIGRQRNRSQFLRTVCPPVWGACYCQMGERDCFGKGRNRDYEIMTKKLLKFHVVTPRKETIENTKFQGRLSTKLVYFETYWQLHIGIGCDLHWYLNRFVNPRLGFMWDRVIGIYI